jgi:hypothetical protein
MTFGYDPTSWLGGGAQAGAGPGGLISLGLESGPAPGNGPSVLFDSDGYPVSIGPDDWPYVSALGLDGYSRLGRMLGSAQGPGDADARTPASAEAAPNIARPPATSIAPESQPVVGTSPGDLASLTPFFGPQLSPQDGASDQASGPSAGLDPPPPPVTAMGAEAVSPVATADTSTLTGPPSFPVDADYWAQPDDSAWRIAQQTYGADDLRAGFEALIGSNQLGLAEDGAPIIYRGQRLTLPDLSSLDPRTRAALDRAGGQRLAHIAQMASASQAPPDPFAQAPPWTAASQPPLPPDPSSSPFGSFDFNNAQSPPPGAPRIGPAPPPLPYLTAALRDGDRGWRDAQARYDETLYPSTIQQAIQSGLDPAGIGHGLSTLALLTEPGGHFVGGLLRPLLPDDPEHPGRRTLRDFVGDSIANLPALALGGGEAAEEADVADELPIGRYADLIRELRGSGEQAHHLNQVAAFGAHIPRDDGLAVGLRGNAFSGVGTPHYDFHASMEDFWQPYRDGARGTRPTNADYDTALRTALQRAGLSPRQASQLADGAAAERAQFPELAPDQQVPRVPRRTGQSRQ